MTEVYNSYKNNSCNNLKRPRYEDEMEIIYSNRYKKIRDYLDEHGLHEVNEDNLVNFFTKKVTLSIDVEMKDAQKQEDIEDECSDDEDEDNSEVLEETEETEEESEWDGFSESEEDSDDEEDEDDEEESEWDGFSESEEDSDDEEESEWDEFSESEYKEDDEDELSEEESIAIKEIEGNIY